jgi:hypothetical protein
VVSGDISTSKIDQMKSIIGVVAVALKDKYGNPSYSPDSVGLFYRAKIWLLENNRYLDETNFYRWSLPDRDVRLAVISYPGRLPGKPDMPWEVTYWVSGKPQLR